MNRISTKRRRNKQFQMRSSPYKGASSPFFENDIEYIDTDGKSNQLFGDDFQASLDSLQPQVDTMMQKLNEQQTHDFNSLVDLINHNSLEESNKKSREIIINKIKTALKSKNTPPIPGTVAAWFNGCDNTENFPGPPECNPRCASSLGAKKCKHNVIILQDGMTITVNKLRESNFAYINVNYGEKIQQKDIDHLLDIGITDATITYIGKDGNISRVTTNIKVSEVLKLKDEIKKEIKDHPTIFIIIGIILLILLIALVYKYMTKE